MVIVDISTCIPVDKKTNMHILSSFLLFCIFPFMGIMIQSSVHHNIILTCKHRRQHPHFFVYRLLQGVHAEEEVVFLGFGLNHDCCCCKLFVF